MAADLDLDALAQRVRVAQDACGRLEPITTQQPGFDLPAAYQVAARVHAGRIAGGARAVGRTIGFTNANIWPEYGVHHPVWGYVYEHTFVDAPDGSAALPLAGLAEPKIEPEIALGLRAAPIAGAEVDELLACIEWVAPAFEIVQSHFPGWKFRAPDTIADGGLHGRLVVGKRVPLASLGGDPAAALAGLTVELRRDGAHVETGRGSNVLGSPLAALGHLVAVLQSQGRAVALQPREVVTTGTVTAAYAATPGQRWEMVPEGIALEPLALALS
jgi:2-oxo-3-hexenedioate decarboxylase